MRWRERLEKEERSAPQLHDKGSQPASHHLELEVVAEDHRGEHQDVPPQVGQDVCRLPRARRRVVPLPALRQLGFVAVGVFGGPIDRM